MTITMTFHWYFIPIALFLFPFLYQVIRTPEAGTFGDMNLDGFLVLVVCWVSVIISVITHFVS